MPEAKESSLSPTALTGRALEAAEKLIVRAGAVLP
jgi:hypothetical protein